MFKFLTLKNNFLLILMISMLVRVLPATASEISELVEHSRPGQIQEIDFYPEKLYHWKSAEGLKKLMAIFNSDQSKFPLRPRGSENALVGISFPNLRELPVFFAWSNPVTGMGSGSGLDYIYGDRVIELRMRKGLKVLLIVSESFKFESDFNKFNEYDLVLHVCKYQLPRDGRYVEVYKEWIIVNPKSVLSFTGDQNLLRPVIAPWLEKLNDPNFEFNEEDLHASHTYLYSPGSERKLNLVPVLQRYMNQDFDVIPTSTIKLTPSLDNTKKIKR